MRGGGVERGGGAERPRGVEKEESSSIWQILTLTDPHWNVTLKEAGGHLSDFCLLWQLGRNQPPVVNPSCRSSSQLETGSQLVAATRVPETELINQLRRFHRLPFSAPFDRFCFEAVPKALGVAFLAEGRRGGLL